jgi:hypothetical protein
MAPEIFHCIRTLSLMDILLTNTQTMAKFQERWPDFKASATSICDARVNLRFKFRPAIMKQNLAPEQRFRRHQFGISEES